MKQLILIGLVVGTCAGNLQAQFLGGFFDQNATRVQYMEQQIAELEVYIKDAEKGYQVVESGLQTIQGITNGEFNLHSVFFSSLKSINPQVSSMAEVAEIIALQIAIAERCSNALKTYQQSPWLHSNEVTYIGQVFSTLLQAGLSDVNTLISLTTANQLQMTDGQRIIKVQAVDTDMKDQYSFLQSFTDGTDLLSQQRQQESATTGSINSFYGLP
jgi:hypothetical protein